jgi:hypothetical protein
MPGVTKGHGCAGSCATIAAIAAASCGSGPGRRLDLRGLDLGVGDHGAVHRRAGARMRERQCRHPDLAVG